MLCYIEIHAINVVVKVASAFRVSLMCIVSGRADIERATLTLRCCQFGPCWPNSVRILSYVMQAHVVPASEHTCKLARPDLMWSSMSTNLSSVSLHQLAALQPFWLGVYQCCFDGSLQAKLQFAAVLWHSEGWKTERDTIQHLKFWFYGECASAVGKWADAKSVWIYSGSGLGTP